MSPLAEAAGFAFRAGAFFAALGLLPGRVVPWAARAALALGALIFLLPAVIGPSAFGFSFTFLESGGRRIPQALSSLPYQRMAAETGFGLLLAIAVSAAMYAAHIFAGAVTMQIAGHLDADQEYPDIGRQTARTLKAAFGLLVMYLLFHTEGFAAVLEYFSRSLLFEPLPAAAGGAASAGAMSAVIIGTGARAFALSAALAVPVFVVSLGVDLFFLLQRRYFPASFSASMVPAVRGVVIALLLSVSVYLYARQFGAGLSESLVPAEADAVLQGAG